MAQKSWKRVAEANGDGLQQVAVGVSDSRPQRAVVYSLRADHVTTRQQIHMRK